MSGPRFFYLQVFVKVYGIDGGQMAHLMIYMSFDNSTGLEPNTFETIHVGTMEIIAGLDGIG